MSKKAEARQKRNVARLQRNEARSIRQANDIPQKKAARSNIENLPQKEIRSNENPNSVFAMSMRWTKDFADLDGSWTWGIQRRWDNQTWDTEINPKLLEFEKLTWNEINQQVYGNEGKRRQMHHNMATEAICKEAQKRLIEIKDVAPEILFRFRLGNLPRLWGVRIVDEFQILWHDPTHKIYPVD